MRSSNQPDVYAVGAQPTFLRFAWVLPLLVIFALCLGYAPRAWAAESGSISGTVTKVGGIEAIEGIEVCSFTTEAPKCTTTDTNGEYTITALKAGAYKIVFISPVDGNLNYIAQFYKDAATPESATAVLVTSGGATLGIDAEMQEGGEIKGTVRSASSAATIEGIEVCAYEQSQPSNIGAFGCANTNSSGEYTISGLETGSYTVEFASPFEGNPNYLTQYYKGKALEPEATPVSVNEGSATTGINAEMLESGGIEGIVTDSTTRAPILGVQVCAFSPGGEIVPVQCTTTDSNGEYLIPALPGGSYQVEFSDGHKYVLQFFNGKSSIFEATTVGVTPGRIAGGINAVLAPIVALAAPIDVSPPGVSGRPITASTLVCSNGLWTGKPVPTFSYRWLRDGAPITNETSDTYKVQKADEGHSLSCEVTATNSQGAKAATSAALAIPAPPPQLSVTGSKVRISHGSARLGLSCTAAPCLGSVELTLRVVSRRHRGKRKIKVTKTLVLAKGTFSLVANTSATTSVRLTATGRKRLAHAAKHHLAVKLTISMQGGKVPSRSVLVI